MAQIMNSTIFAIFETPHADPAMKLYPLLATAWPTTWLLAGYLLFVLKIGRVFMENRKPYNLKNIILVYNAIQVIYNAIIFMIGVYYLVIKTPYDMKCMQTLPLDHRGKDTERLLSYTFFINKFLDLLDTIFFVLRKSYKQITFLHVYHHSMMFYGVYWLTRFYGVGGQYVTMGLFNSFVHTVMYSYYFFSAMYPGLKGSLWWKKYITGIQLLQFLVLFMQSLRVLLFNPSCKFPLFLQYLQIYQTTVLTFMFGKFYYHAYIKPNQQKTQ